MNQDHKSIIVCQPINIVQVFTLEESQSYVHKIVINSVLELSTKSDQDVVQE
jgi:hypothetical protein